MSLRRADHSSREVLLSVVCLSVIVKPRQWKWPSPTRSCPPLKKVGWKVAIRLQHLVMLQTLKTLWRGANCSIT